MDIDQLVGARIREIRLSKHPERWSQSHLCERIGRLGGSVTISSLSRIENGTRPLSVRELVLFAIALDVPPIALAAPVGEPWHDIEVTDELVLHPMISLQWWLGMDGPATGGQGKDERGFPLANRPIGDHLAAKEAGGPYRAWLRMFYLQDRFTDARAEVHALSDRGIYAQALGREEREELTAEAKRRMRHEARSYLGALRAVRSHGIEPPALPRRDLMALAASLDRVDYETWKAEEGLRDLDDTSEQS